METLSSCKRLKEVLSGEIAESVLGNLGVYFLQEVRNRMPWTFNESLIWHSLALLSTELRGVGLFSCLPLRPILGEA